MPTITSTATASDFSRNMGATVSDFVAGLQRINARRAASRSAAHASATHTHAVGAAGRRCEASIPGLSSGFGYAAWLG